MGNQKANEARLKSAVEFAKSEMRERVAEIADYLARHREVLRSEEASAARVLRELVKNQRLG